MDHITWINPTLQGAISFCLIYAKMQHQNSIRTASEQPLCRSAPNHPCPGDTRQPCSLTHPSAFCIISPVFNSCHFITSSLQPTLFSGLKPCIFVCSDLQQAASWFAAPSWSRSPQTMTQDSASQTNFCWLLSLSSSSCWWNGTAYGFGLSKPLYQVFVQLWCLAAGTRRWTTGSTVLGRLLVPLVCWTAGQGLSTAATALPGVTAAAEAIKPVKLTQHTLRKRAKVIISITSKPVHVISFFPDRVDNLLLNVFHILCAFSSHLLLPISYGISNFLAQIRYQDGTRWLLPRTGWLKTTEITDHTLLLAINISSLFISN